MDNILIENNVIFQKFMDAVLINYTNSKKANWLTLYQNKSLFIDNNNNNNIDSNNKNNNINNDNNSGVFDANDDTLQNSFK